MNASLSYTVQCMAYGEKCEYNYDELASTFYCRDILLKLGDCQITHCSTEFSIHNIVTYELIQKRVYF